MPFARTTASAAWSSTGAPYGHSMSMMAHDRSRRRPCAASCEDAAAIDPLALEHRTRVVQAVAQDVDPGVAPRHQRAVEPDHAVAIVHRQHAHRTTSIAAAGAATLRRGRSSATGTSIVPSLTSTAAPPTRTAAMRRRACRPRPRAGSAGRSRAPARSRSGSCRRPAARCMPSQPPSAAAALPVAGSSSTPLPGANMRAWKSRRRRRRRLR